MLYLPSERRIQAVIAQAYSTLHVSDVEGNNNDYSPSRYLTWRVVTNHSDSFRKEAICSGS